MHIEQGLRERKKAATRRALGEAALRLAMEHGIGSVTAEAIAAAADVSSRTFHNYFSSKEEAIVSVVADRINDVIEAFRARPADEPVWDSLEHVMLDFVDPADGSAGDFVAEMTFIHENASLVGEEVVAMKDTIERFTQAVAERTGTDPDRDLYPQLQAAAATVCGRVALHVWFTDQSAVDVRECTRQAFAMMRAGLPGPAGEPEPSRTRAQQDQGSLRSIPDTAALRTVTRSET